MTSVRQMPAQTPKKKKSTAKKSVTKRYETPTQSSQIRTGIVITESTLSKKVLSSHQASEIEQKVPSEESFYKDEPLADESVNIELCQSNLVMDYNGMKLLFYNT